MSTPTRRQFLAASAGIAAASSCSSLPSGTAPGDGEKRIRQSVANWCFANNGEKWDVPTLARHAKALGCDALELVPTEQWPVLREHGLICAATRSHGFVRGMNNPAHHAECLQKLEDAIDASEAAGYPNVMTFTGFTDTTSEGGSVVDADAGRRHCIEGYKKIVGRAEKAGVQLILEPLNTRDAAPMKGHPGYQGDHVDACAEIVRAVGSPGLKLLFDVYHAQIMDGDLVRRIHEHADIIGHVQVAGCPGRGSLGANQEINYPAVMQAFVDVGYRGYVGHEFIPGDDPLAELTEAVRICDV